MKLNDYQKWTRKIWSGNKKKLTLHDDFVMCVGLAGETGEVLEILKKKVRDKKMDKGELVKELGDVLYYMMMICNRHGIQAEDVIKVNVNKLHKRFPNRR
jgi:NTP pyrophosphatase (non-canonical NTP hydrolase)